MGSEHLPFDPYLRGSDPLTFANNSDSVYKKKSGLNLSNKKIMCEKNPQN